MYKKTTPQQKLFGVDTQLSPSLRNRLKSSWAQLFKIEVLPILFRNEDRYAMLYGKTGRPNFSVARVLGLCLLQEFNDLSDQQALDTFSFDIRWRHALDVSDEEDYLSRRSLVEFRRRLAAKDPEMKLVRNVFDNIRDTAIKKLRLSARDQRLDSTHIVSNIRTRGRLALFSNTLTVFLKSLNEDQFSKVPEAIQKWHSSESEGWFGLGPAEQRVKLEELAQYIYESFSLKKIMRSKLVSLTSCLNDFFVNNANSKMTIPQMKNHPKSRSKKSLRVRHFNLHMTRMHLTDIKAQDTAFISPRPVTIPGTLKSSPTMTYMVPPGLISARLFQLSSGWTLPG